MPNHHQIIIIGAGTAGITVAARLLNKNRQLDIAIIDPAEKHYYQPAWTLVGAGTYPFKKTERSMKSLIPKGAKWIKDAVTEIQPDRNQVKTQDGLELNYDYLVVCPGIQTDLDGIEGLREAINQDAVCSNYIDPEYTWEVLQNFKGGNALFTMPATPVKCGGAPQKIMYLADDYFQRVRVSKDTNVIFATPGSVIFGLEPFRSTLERVVKRKDISLRFFHKLTRIDPTEKKAYYTIFKHAGEPEKLFFNPKPELNIEQVSETEVAIPYDMVHLAPPQSAPDFIKRSGISYQEGQHQGWLEVDHGTLQHPQYSNVFGLGDAAALPTAKTGAAIRKQAPVVVENLLQVMNGQLPIARYAGYSSCPIVTGYGKMVLAEFKYGNVRDSDPMITTFVDTGKESYLMWLLKKYGLPFMYWQLMMKGWA